MRFWTLNLPKLSFRKFFFKYVTLGAVQFDIKKIFFLRHGSYKKKSMCMLKCMLMAETPKGLLIPLIPLSFFEKKKTALTKVYYLRSVMSMESFSGPFLVKKNLGGT